VGCALLLALALSGVLTHATLSRATRDAQRHPEVRVLPSASLVLSSRSRWLRHPLMSEPGAAFQDGPAFFDADPAGALHSPPRSLFRAEAPSP